MSTQQGKACTTKGRVQPHQGKKGCTSVGWLDLCVLLMMIEEFISTFIQSAGLLRTHIILLDYNDECYV